MWKYIRKYLLFAVLAILFMIGEVSMDLLQPDLMSRIIDDGVLGISNGGVGDMGLILRIGLLMIGTVVLGGVCGSCNNAFVHLTGQNAGNSIRKDCFSRIMTYAFPQVDDFSTGSLITRVTNDITQVQNLISQFVRGTVRTAMLTLGSLFFMFRLNTQFGWIVVCTLPLLLGCIVFCLSRTNPLFFRLQNQLDRVNEILQEDISGIRIIKACVREVYEKLRFGKANDELIHTQLITLTIFACMNPIMFAIMNSAIVVLLYSGSRQIAFGGVTPGTIMAAITYTTQLLNGILMLIMLFQNISRGTASWKRVREILDTQPVMTDGGFDGRSSKKGEIEFRNVSFAFPGSQQVVLHDIDLKIHAGETIAVMGATGCGKTALASLIPRFYDVTAGSVLVDGVDVRQYDQTALRDKIAVALQKSELFSVSIGENISWGDGTASREQIRAAAAIAQATDFIEKTADGYDTLVAERGMSLSGGQKQRLSIARAVLKPSEILIFDDSTSALDLRTEANLYQALEAARPDTTKIIIAQRIASVRRADRILVLDGGTIADIGTHAELLRRCAIYQDIYNSQIGEETEEHEQ
ncbi:MAG: ABC transporter ATP-binding protein [Clostridia bacterium]|nr:ABC transporter ATP-binding protein [Clostridia bacterium]